MKIICDYSLSRFPAWSGAVDTKERIIAENKEDAFESLVNDLFPDGCTDTELNDYLWFEEESIYSDLGIDSDDEDLDEDSEDE